MRAPVRTSRGRLETLRTRLRAFTEARDWGKFHTPKNLAIALSVEASELLELFQWLTDEQAKEIHHKSEEMRRIKEELADVFVYLIRLGDVLGVDLAEAALAKIAINERKYPTDIFKGIAAKYNRRLR